MAEPMVSAASFAKASNVTAAAVSKALKSGRLQAYSKAGRRVSPAFRGPKFLKLEEAKESFQYNRVGIDSAFLAKEAGFGDTKHGKSHQNLVNAKVEKERLQSELLEMRLARQQGDVIPRAAAIAAAESLGRAVRRAVAVRQAMNLYQGPPSRRAKELADRYRSYLASGWLRERDLESLPHPRTTERFCLHRLARRNEGGSLSWRTIYYIASSPQG
jgi:hypothetical protein